MNKKFAELMGWIGMVSIHGATIPVSIRAINGTAATLPPWDMVFFVWLGLFLFFIRAWGRMDWLYLISNGIGFFIQSVLLALIAFN